MEAFERPHGKTLRARLEEDPRWIVVITGPRQAGKTTLVSQVLGQVRRPSIHIAVDAPDPTATLPSSIAIATATPDSARSTAPSTALPPVDKRDTRWLVREWEQARLAARRSERGFVLALDEIQKIPDWSETVPSHRIGNLALVAGGFARAIDAAHSPGPRRLLRPYPSPPRTTPHSASWGPAPHPPDAPRSPAPGTSPRTPWPSTAPSRRPDRPLSPSAPP